MNFVTIFMSFTKINLDENPELTGDMLKFIQNLDVFNFNMVK